MTNCNAPHLTATQNARRHDDWVNRRSPYEAGMTFDEFARYWGEEEADRENPPFLTRYKDGFMVQVNSAPAVSDADFPAHWKALHETKPPAAGHDIVLSKIKPYERVCRKCHMMATEIDDYSLIQCDDAQQARLWETETGHGHALDHQRHLIIQGMYAVAKRRQTAGIVIAAPKQPAGGMGHNFVLLRGSNEKRCWRCGMSFGETAIFDKVTCTAAHEARVYEWSGHPHDTGKQPRRLILANLQAKAENLKTQP